MKATAFLFSALIFTSAVIHADDAPWHFVVAGDSRNCGDVVMPAIAARAKAEAASFYWHLGDFRAIYRFDEDMAQEAALAQKPLDIGSYLRTVWGDAIRNQVAPFGEIPVYVAIGNHETISPKSRPEFIAQFADWLNQPSIQQQRLLDDKDDHLVKTYYHWIVRGVDFITLDNGSADMFDDAQVSWFEKVLASDARNGAIKAVVVGMHAALPHGLACDHSMSDSAQGDRSGSRVYTDLLRFRDSAKKAVYVLASHSHFVIDGIFDSDYWRANGGVLPGWIIGTSGAIRYRLPDTASRAKLARTDVYGYLLATVNPPGAPEAIAFEFRPLDRADVPAPVVSRYTSAFVDQCFQENRDMRAPKPVTCADATPCSPAPPRP